MTTRVGLIVPGGFPQRLSSFVGRETDIVEVNRLIRTAQLLTLVGPPGAGKTRLAMELVDRRMRVGRTEVMLLELDDGTPGSVAEKLGRALTADARPRDRGTRQSADRLIVLNDCDRVLEECGQVLSRCLPHQPRAQVLVTSREALRLPGEVVYPLAGLSLPAPAATGSAIEHLRSDAVTLFTDRARAADPAFTLTDRNADTVGRICAKVDGLPLAIELAAGLVRVFSLTELADRLEDRLSTLAGGWRTAVERHRSWRAALSWGYEFLDPSEQELFRNVSIFPDGFAVGAAAAACGRSADDPAVLAALIALETKSMVHASRRPATAPARFRVLDSVRCYGQERLAETGQQALAGARVVEWAADTMLASLRPAFLSTSQVRGIGEERDNIRMALRLLAGSDDERQLPLAAALVTAEAMHGKVAHDTRDVTRQVLTSTDEGSAHRYLGVEAAATLAGHHKENAAELRLTEQAAALSRTAPGHAGTVRLMLKLSLIQDVHGDQRSSLASLEECRVLNRLLRDDRADALYRAQLAWLRLVHGRLDQATQLIEPALPLLRDRDPLILARHAMNTAGAIALEQDDLPQAVAMFLEALRNGTDYPHTTAYALAGLGIAAVRQSRFQRGLRLIAAAAELDEFGLRTRGWWRNTVPVAQAAAARLMSRAEYDSAVAGGRATPPQEAVRALLAEPSGPEPATAPGTHPLSRREWQVMALLTQGLTNRQIAARMHLSVRTVETHVRNIRDTLGLRSRTHVAAWAIENSSQRPGDALFASLALQGPSGRRAMPESASQLVSPPDLTGDYNGDRCATGAYLTMADELLSTLPEPPSRDGNQRRAAQLVHATARQLRVGFLASHAEQVYDELTLRRTTWPGLAELAFAAADLIPGLAPSRYQMAQEARCAQHDKEGREIDQGILFQALLDSPKSGTHLIESMRYPTARATGLLPEFQATGRITLTAARLERHGAGGYVTITNEHCLNAEDNNHVADVETLVDIVLLDPGVRVGVLRGGTMTHARYAGRRVFSAGINLKELRAGNISYVDFLLRRELGFISKLMRGINEQNAGWPPGPVRKPWLAAVDAFAIGGGAQILLACDRVIADAEAYFRLPAAREGIIPGASNLRLTRFLGARAARQVILWDRPIAASDPDAHLVFDQIVAPAQMDSAIAAAVERLAAPAVAANRHMLNLAEEPAEDFRRYLAAFALEQALRAYSPDVLGK